MNAMITVSRIQGEVFDQERLSRLRQQQPAENLVALFQKSRGEWLHSIREKGQKLEEFVSCTSGRDFKNFSLAEQLRQVMEESEGLRDQLMAWKKLLESRMKETTFLRRELEDWKGKALEAKEREGELTREVTGLNAIVDRLEGEKQQLQREVDWVRELPDLERRYRQLNREVRSHEWKLIVERGGRTVLTLVVVTTITVASSVLGPFAAPVALGAPVPVMRALMQSSESPRFREVCDERADVFFQILQIRTKMTREEYLAKSEEEQERISRELIL